VGQALAAKRLLGLSATVPRSTLAPTETFCALLVTMRAVPDATTLHSTAARTDSSCREHPDPVQPQAPAMQLPLRPLLHPVMQARLPRLPLPQPVPAR